MITKKVLSNGITILTKPARHNQIVAVRACFAGGSRCEKADQGGMANVALSLLLKDTAARSAAETAEYLESSGAGIWRDVQRDFGAVSTLCTEPALPVALEALCDAIRRPLFLPERVDVEKQTILLSLREEDDNLLTYTSKAFLREIYGEHPYGRPLRGEPETIGRISRDQVADFYGWGIRPDRLTVACVGNIDEESFVREIEQRLGDWQAAAGSPDGDLPSPPEADKVRTVTRNRGSGGAWIVLGYLGPSVFDPDHVPMKVLDCILGGSMDCRLFRTVREEKGLAYQVGSAQPDRVDRSVLFVYVGTTPEKKEEAVQSVLGEIERIRDEPPTEDELARAKTYLRGSFVIGQETHMGQASLLGTSEALGLGYGYVSRYPEEVSRVTADDVCRVARTYLTNHILAVTMPAEAGMT